MVRALARAKFLTTPPHVKSPTSNVRRTVSVKKRGRSTVLEAKLLASSEAMNINPCLGFAVLHADSTVSAVCPYGSLNEREREREREKESKRERWTELREKEDR